MSDKEKLAEIEKDFKESYINHYQCHYCAHYCPEDEDEYCMDCTIRNFKWEWRGHKEGD